MHYLQALVRRRNWRVGTGGTCPLKFSVSAMFALCILQKLNCAPQSTSPLCMLHKRAEYIYACRCLLTVADLSISISHWLKHKYISLPLLYLSYVGSMQQTHHPHTHLYTSCPAGQTAFIPTVLDWLYCIWGCFVLDNPRGEYTDKVGITSPPTHMYNIAIHYTFTVGFL